MTFAIKFKGSIVTLLGQKSVLFEVTPQLFSVWPPLLCSFWQCFLLYFGNDSFRITIFCCRLTFIWFLWCSMVEAWFVGCPGQDWDWGDVETLPLPPTFLLFRVDHALDQLSLLLLTALGGRYQHLDKRKQVLLWNFIPTSFHLPTPRRTLCV